MTDSMPSTILVVDDEPVNRALFKAMLSPLGVEVVLAADGEEALARFDAGDIDLVVLDVMMPGLNGIEVLQRIRARTDLPWTPVIIATAYNERQLRLDALEAGADEFAEKPIDRAVLLARVRTLLRLRDAQAELKKRAEALERSTRKRRELMEFIVHDMKNPLAVVRMNLMYVLEAAASTLGTDETDALTDAVNSSKRMEGMVTDLLTLERMEQAQLTLSRSTVCIRDLLEEIVRMRHLGTHSQGVEVRVTAGALNVEADLSLLRRLIENLFENALRHVPRNGIIELSVEEGDSVAITVSNSGEPIPVDMHEEIFEKFVRLNGSNAGRIGIGLFFCRKVAVLHGGNLTVTDREGWPVSFRLELPAFRNGVEHLNLA